MATKVVANEVKVRDFHHPYRTCPSITLNGLQIPQANEAKYLGFRFDRRLCWRNHIFAKWKQLGILLRNMYWLIGRKSQLLIESKTLFYKNILKPMWTYGAQLWSTAAEHSDSSAIPI